MIAYQLSRSRSLTTHSQPIYVAACAFLKDSVIHTMSSKPPSRAPTPPLDRRNAATTGTENTNPSQNRNNTFTVDGTEKDFADQQKIAAKHTLLATAANQNYQRCYKALQQVETYWAGTKYILTVLDQKVKGVGDPLLYTKEEMESALEAPKPEPSFTSPGWR
jgi:hypothetical protein